MTKYVKSRVISTDDVKKPYVCGNVSDSEYACVPRMREPMNIKKYFIDKYQTRKEWYKPCGINLNALV